MVAPRIPEKWVPKGGVPKDGVPKGGGPHFVFPLPLPFSLFFFSRERGILMVFGAPGPSRQPENSKRAQLRVPALQTPPKIPREDPREREKRSKMGTGEGKNKKRNFGRSGGRGVQRSPFTGVGGVPASGGRAQGCPRDRTNNQHQQPQPQQHQHRQKWSGGQTQNKCGPKKVWGAKGARKGGVPKGGQRVGTSPGV